MALKASPVNPMPVSVKNDRLETPVQPRAFLKERSAFEALVADAASIRADAGSVGHGSWDSCMVNANFSINRYEFVMVHQHMHQLLTSTSCRICRGLVQVVQLCSHFGFNRSTGTLLQELHTSSYLLHLSQAARGYVQTWLWRTMRHDLLTLPLSSSEPNDELE